MEYDASDLSTWRRYATRMGLDPDGLYKLDGKGQEVTGAEIARRIVVSKQWREAQDRRRQLEALLSSGLPAGAAQSVVDAWRKNVREAINRSKAMGDPLAGVSPELRRAAARARRSGTRDANRTTNIFGR